VRAFLIFFFGCFQSRIPLVFFPGHCFFRGVILRQPCFRNSSTLSGTASASVFLTVFPSLVFLCRMPLFVLFSLLSEFCGPPPSPQGQSLPLPVASGSFDRHVSARLTFYAPISTFFPDLRILSLSILVLVGSCPFCVMSIPRRLSRRSSIPRTMRARFPPSHPVPPFSVGYHPISPCFKSNRVLWRETSRLRLTPLTLFSSEHSLSITLVCRIIFFFY